MHSQNHLKTPFFSIGVTTYNRLQLLKETLDSILNQTYENFEVLIGNDNPERQLSQEMLGIDDNRVKIINRKKNLREMGNMNALLKEAEGKYFTWLADDDLYTKNYLQTIKHALDKFHQPICIFPRCTMDLLVFRSNSVDASNATMVEFRGEEFLREYLEKKIELQGCYGIFDLNYLKNVGGMVQLGNGFSPYSDIYLAIQTGLLKKVIYIDTPLVLFRNHEESMSATSIDIHSYLSAQKDLMIKLKKIWNNQQKHHYLLTKWFMNDYLGVIIRNKSKQTQPLNLSYHQIKKYIFNLKGVKYQSMFILYCSYTIFKAFYHCKRNK